MVKCLDEIEQDTGKASALRETSGLSARGLLPGGDLRPLARASVKVRSVVLRHPTSHHINPHPHPHPYEGWEKANRPPAAIRLGEQANENHAYKARPTAHELCHDENPNERLEGSVAAPDNGSRVELIPSESGVGGKGAGGIAQVRDCQSRQH